MGSGRGTFAGSPATHLLLAAQFLTGRGPVLVRGLGVGDPWFKPPSLWHFVMAVLLLSVVGTNCNPKNH